MKEAQFYKSDRLVAVQKDRAGYSKASRLTLTGAAVPFHTQTSSKR